MDELKQVRSLKDLFKLSATDVFDAELTISGAIWTVFVIFGAIGVVIGWGAPAIVLFIVAMTSTTIFFLSVIFVRIMDSIKSKRGK